MRRKLDTNRLKRLLGEIEEALKVLEETTSLDEETYLDNMAIRYAARYAIVAMVEAMAIAGLHMLEELYGESPETYAEIFDALGRRGIIKRSLAEKLRRLAGLRNIVVHRYWEVDDVRIKLEAQANGILAVKEFMRELTKFLEES